MASGKYFFCGVGQELHPGAIQIWKFPPEKINEIQAHGLGISRMRISYDNKYKKINLFFVFTQLQQEIEAMMNDNKETMKQINEDADKEIKDIEQKN